MLSLVNFGQTTERENWTIVNDGVMGGKSSGNVEIINGQYLKFFGEVSLENNGGFTSVRKSIKELKVAAYEKVQIKLKGDGKNYQFRLKKDQNDEHSYSHEFTTTGEWETLTISFNKLQPVYRGNELEKPPFQGDIIDQIGFLIANKRAEKFTLLVEEIKLV